MKRWAWFWGLVTVVCAGALPARVSFAQAAPAQAAPPQAAPPQAAPAQAAPPQAAPPQAAPPQAAPSQAAPPQTPPAPAPSAPPPPAQPGPQAEPAQSAAQPPAAQSPGAAPEPDAEPSQRVSPSTESSLRAPPRQWFGSPHAAFVPPFDVRQHVGFSLRVSVGIGFAIAEREIRRGHSQISGINGIINLDIGAAAMENLIVFGRIGGTGFDHARSSDSRNVGSAFFGVFGAGVRYHFMPIDWYAAGVLAMTGVGVTNDLGSSQDAGPGFGMELETGKNWWAGSYRERWTVGLGIRFAYLRSGAVQARPGERTDDPWQATALSLVFSTSYN